LRRGSQRSSSVKKIMLVQNNYPQAGGERVVFETREMLA
jgi:hypothetical protein